MFETFSLLPFINVLTIFGRVVVKFRKGVSQVTSAILLLVVTLSGLAYYIVEANKISASSIVTISEAHDRMVEKISIGLQLVDLYINGSDVVAVVYNYGDEDVYVSSVFHPRRNYTIYSLENDALIQTNVIKSKKLALMVFHNSSLEDFSPIVLEVKGCGIYEIPS